MQLSRRLAICFIRQALRQDTEAPADSMGKIVRDPYGQAVAQVPSAMAGKMKRFGPPDPDRIWVAG